MTTNMSASCARRMASLMAGTGSLKKTMCGRIRSPLRPRVCGLLQIGYQAMRRVGLRFNQLVTALVVELVYKLRVCGESLGGGYLHHRISLP